jgi:hypothetical protein
LTEAPIVITQPWLHTDLDLDGLPGEQSKEHGLHTIVELEGFFAVLNGHESPDGRF